jgi:hypothetical protein
VILCGIIDLPATSGERRGQGGETMFAKQNGDGYRQALAGIEQKTLVHGDKTLMVDQRRKEQEYA